MAKILSVGLARQGMCSQYKAKPTTMCAKPVGTPFHMYPGRGLKQMDKSARDSMLHKLILESRMYSFGTVLLYGELDRKLA